MNVFTRYSDIVNSNIFEIASNSKLDRNPPPEKLIRLTIDENK